jgi:hypothetical protein
VTRWLGWLAAATSSKIQKTKKREREKTRSERTFAIFGHEPIATELTKINK